MEIGRKILNEAEFSNLWGILYQEFYNLSVTNACDATLVYNTIYIICTSGSSFENKLYWKIGDFLLNRCKIHRDQILESDDYIAEYIVRFDEFQKLVESINSLGIFLNDSVKEKKLNEFGYLLWERMVIQSFTDTFFIDVFQYNGEVMKILNSFEKIIPDSTQKLLYYKEKYEKVALQQIKSKYVSINFSNLEEFCDITRIVVRRETEHMKKYLLPCSYEAVMNVMEECLLLDKNYELIINLKNYFYTNNTKSIKNIVNNSLHAINQTSNNIMKSSSGQVYETDEIRPDFGISFEPGHKSGSNRINDTEISTGMCENMALFSNFYERLTEEKKEAAKSYIDGMLEDNKMFIQIQPIINKKPDHKLSEVDCRQTNPIFANLMESIGILDAGFIQIKKAYALYVESVLKSNMNVLESSIKNVYLMLEMLEIFQNLDCRFILYSLFKQYLQRAKPCFMKRLCDFTQDMVNVDTSVSNLRPFELNDNIKIFCKVIDLISDRSEYMNMYQTALKERIISGESEITKEYAILNTMKIPKDDKLFKMLEEIESQRSPFKILNSINWNIEPENSSLAIPETLLSEIKAEIPQLNIIQKYQNGGASEMKYKIKDKDMPEKIVQIAHQYSKIVLNINGILIKMNIYQYIVVDLLSNEPVKVEDISNLTGISDQILKGTMHSLIDQRIVSCKQNKYYLSCEDIQECDISNIEQVQETQLDICADSYIQALGVKLLKRMKRADIGKLIKEIKGVSRLDVNEAFVTDSVKKIIEKGMAEIKNSNIEYVF